MTGDGLVDLLAAETSRLVALLRGWSDARWRAGAAAGGIGSRADVVLHLTRWLACAAQGVEEAGATTEPAWREVPPAPRPGALPDRLATVGHDLFWALEPAARAPGAGPDACPADVPDRIWWPGGGRLPAPEVAARAVAEVLLHRHELAAGSPSDAVAAAVLAGLGEPPVPRPVVAVLARARLLCPVR